MEFSGEDDQSNSAGTYPIGSDQQQQEWWNHTPLPDDQMREPDWWNQTHVPSHHVEEQERSGRWAAPADAMENSGQPVQPFTSDADAADEHSLSRRGASRKQRACSFVGLVER